MIQWKLIICLKNKTWYLDDVEYPDHIEERDIYQDYLEEKRNTEIVYIGTYSIINIDDE